MAHIDEVADVIARKMDSVFGDDTEPEETPAEVESDVAEVPEEVDDDTDLTSGDLQDSEDDGEAAEEEVDDSEHTSKLFWDLAPLEDADPAMRSYMEAVKDQLVEKDSMISRQGNEIGELRKTTQRIEGKTEEVEQRLDEGIQAPFVPTEEWESWAGEQIEEGYGREAAIAAADASGRDAYDFVIYKWQETDPVGAARFDREFHAAVAAYENQEAELPASPDVEDVKQAVRVVAARHSDLPELWTDMQQTLDSLPDSERDMLARLDATGLDGKVMVLEHLHARAKAATADTLRSKQVKVKKARQQSQDSAALEATVASATASSRGVRTPATGYKTSDSYAAFRKEAGLPD